MTAQADAQVNSRQSGRMIRALAMLAKRRMDIQ
jgi:hypothetical protein